ncbi:hypothetical protein N9850_08810 [Granulosicoccus sp.]|nr:hypothetical protein [Granulosicoccus sp.]
MQKFAIYEQAVYEDIMSKAHSNEIHYDPLSESNRAAFDRRPDIIWLKEKFNIYERFGVRLSDNPSRCDLLAITYDASRGNVSNKEEAALMEIVPHLSQALCISTTFSILRARYKAALAAIEKIRIGIFLLDIDGHIILIIKLLGT